MLTEQAMGHTNTESCGMARQSWQPEWTIDCGQGCEAGLTIDDGCFGALLPNGAGQWRPTRWIPMKVAEKIASLITDH